MTTEQHRKMLECAAKACGYEILDWYGERYTAHDGEKLIAFNPLTNPADTAEMCAKLDINHMWMDGYIKCWQWKKPPVRIEHNGTDEDKKAAWRLAASIVAAKIGGYSE